MDILCTIFTCVCVLLLLLCITFFYLLIKIFAGKSINNPSYPPVKGTIFGLIFIYRKLYDYQTQLAKKQPTFRLLVPGHSAVYTTDTRNIEHVLKSNFQKYSKGEGNQEIFADLLGQGIFAVDGEKWRQQRKLASFEFSTRVLRDYSCSVFRLNAAKLVRVIMEFAVAGGGAFDMQDLLMRYALDSIFKVGFGVELNCMDESKKDGIEFMKAFDNSNALVAWRFVDPFWKLKRFLNIGSESTLRKNIQVLDSFVQNVITTKKKLMADQGDLMVTKEDILSRFLLENKKNPETVNDKYLRDIILNFMFAGKDTTASTLSWFFYLLCKNPRVQEKIAQEILANATNFNSTQEHDRTSIEDFVESINDQTLDQMHYLHAALTETLRLYPVVPVDGRCTEVDDVLPDGHRVKKGDGVYYVAYAMGRMCYIWGEDAEEFRPERWLKNGIFQPESPFKFIAFHAGPRICLGKDFAYRQMKILSMALLRFFRFKLANETKNITYKIMFTLHIEEGLNLHAFSRISLNEF